MWHKQGKSLDDSNFDMENYYFLVDVKFLKSYWNKLLSNFCITVRRFRDRVQCSTCATYEKCNNGRANSEIGYTTDCLCSFWDSWILYAVFFCWYHCKHIFGRKKNRALLTDLLKVNNNMFLPDNCHTWKRTYSLNIHP